MRATQRAYSDMQRKAILPLPLVTLGYLILNHWNYHRCAARSGMPTAWC